MIVNGAALTGQGSAHAITVKSLSKGYGEAPVLRGLDFTVSWGEAVALFGSNGAGKTTLLRALAAQSRPDAGQVLVAGYDTRRQAEAARRSVGVVSHRPLLYEDLTCRENLTFYGKLYQVAGIRQRVADVLERVGMSRHAEQRARSLSHGMQKRVALARAMLHQPPVLLLDEAETGLDRNSVAMLRSVVEEWTAAGRAVLFVTHNLALGAAWANRAVTLSGGKIVAHAPETATRNQAPPVKAGQT